MKLVLRILFLVCLLMLQATPALASTSADVSITVTPLVSIGITDFLITYVNDNQLDISWNYSGDITNVMVRAKYGSYPDNPLDVNTAPNDGYFIYYGSGTSASDTSMDFNNNLGQLFISAWGQKSDGTWILTSSSDFKESMQLILLNGTLQIGLILIAMITFLTLAYIFKKPIFLWIASFMALLWGVLMGQNTTLLGEASYIWTTLGAGLFIAFLLLTRTLNPTKKEVLAIDDTPEDIREAQLEREAAKRQFNSIRIRPENRLKVRNKYGLRG